MSEIFARWVEILCNGTQLFCCAKTMFMWVLCCSDTEVYSGLSETVCSGYILLFAVCVNNSVASFCLSLGALL